MLEENLCTFSFKPLTANLFMNVLKQLYYLKIHKDIFNFAMNDIVNLIFIKLDE